MDRSELRARQLASLPQLLAEPEDVGRVVQGSVPTEDGVRVPVRLYRADLHSPSSTIVYLHGGGWVAGSVGGSDYQARRIANRLGAVVVSVGYRRAPEDPFPSGLLDACAVLGAAAELGRREGNPSRVVVLGESAGANLAAAACLALRDVRPQETASLLFAQVLICPVTDLEWSGASFDLFGDGPEQLGDALRHSGAAYLSGDGRGSDEAYVSPLRAGDLHGLPPAVVVTAEFDPLRDQGEAFARRLRAAGNPVVCRRMIGQDHGFFTAPHDEAASAAFEDVMDLVRGALGPADRFHGNNEG